MLDIRELSKSITSRLPISALENAANYAVLRANPDLLPSEYIIRDRAAYFGRVRDQLGGETVPLLFLEFGVYQGDSIRQWAALNSHPDSRFVGFDSFIGLPERWRGRAAGYFDCGGKLPAIDDARVSFVPGWFNQTLPAALDRLLPTGCQVVVHLDADLYSAALYCLSMLGARLPEFPVLFDEFGAGEGRALRDVLAAHGGSFTPLLGLKRGRLSSLPTRVFGRLRLGGGS